MPNAGAKNFPLTYYYNPNRAKWPETELGNKKSSKSFSDLLLSLAAGGRLVFSYFFVMICVFTNYEASYSEENRSRS